MVSSPIHNSPSKTVLVLFSSTATDCPMLEDFMIGSFGQPTRGEPKPTVDDIQP
jgi:hypothetical protein